MGLDLIAEFEGLLDALAAAGAGYAVCGGLAVNIHGHVRATRDIDLLILKEDLTRVLAAVRPLGFTLEAGPIPFGVGTANARELHRISKIHEGALLTLDLLLVTPVFEQVWGGRQRSTWHQRDIWVVSLGGLAVMKRLAGRTQDLADLENLGVETESGDEP